MTRGLMWWITRLLTSYTYTAEERQLVDDAHEAIAEERAAFEERMRNIEARFERLDIQGEVMEKPRGHQSE